ncbi:MAG: PAS domain S-box protein [Gammaproteobacteria bacterium]|nr:PAS domain S-box protein [Gammaproteobacteria bacterium]
MMTIPENTDSTLISLVKAHTAIWLVACLGVVLTGATLWVVEHVLQVHRSLEFEWVAHNRIGTFKQGIKNGLNAVEAIRDLYRFSQDVREDEFQLFAHSVMNRYRGIQALMWVPNVPHEQRSSYEILRENGQGSFPILEKTADGRMVSAGRRDHYHPVHYVEPQEENLYRGLDLASIQVYRETLERARESGKMAVSERVELLQDSVNRHGFFACLPIYDRVEPMATQGQYPKDLVGYAVGVFRLDDLAEASVALLEPRGVEFMIHDESVPDGPRLMDFYASRLSRQDESPDFQQPQDWARQSGPRYKEVFEVADRTWSITCAPTDQFRSAIAFQQSHWVVLGVGLLFTTLVTLYLSVNKQRLLERIIMERVLREREELFWQMTETVDDVFWALDLETDQFLYVSPAYESLWGDSCERLYTHTEAFTEVIHQEDRQERSVALDRVRQGETDVEVVYRIIQPDGTVRWIRESEFPVRDETGEVFRIVGVAEDITERWLADKALQESEVKMRTLFNYSPDIIMTIDGKGRILMINRSIPGLLAEKAVGRDSAVLLPHDFRRLYRRHLKKVFRMGKVRHLRYSTSEGSWWEVRVVPVTVADEVTTAMVVATNVTEITALHGQMMRTARLATIGVLAAGVAHEINNPNNAIGFNASLFTRVWTDATLILEDYYRENGDFSLGGLSFAEARETLPRLLVDIGKNSKRIKRIVENLKHLSRQDASEFDGEVDVQAVLEESAMILSNKIQKYTDAFRLKIKEGLPVVKGNSQELEQVFINVILNALQSLPDRHAGVRVRATYDASKNRILVEVQDQGSGIDEQQLQDLTKPFFTTKTASGGLGLGLSISATILKRHKGWMKFESELGKGTTVTIKLPVKS